MDAVKSMLKWLNGLDHVDYYERFRLLVEIWFCAYTRSEERYLQIVDKLGKPATRDAAKLLGEVILDMTQDPRDILGMVYQEYSVTNKHMQQYFTPLSVAICMAQMTLSDVKKQDLDKPGGFTIQEPCCGSGALIIAALNSLVEKFGAEKMSRVGVCLIDKDILCCWMATLQLLWYPAPLGGLQVWHGNTLGNLEDLQRVISFGSLWSEDPNPKYTKKLRAVEFTRMIRNVEAE
jgi:hypothetical protein